MEIGEKRMTVGGGGECLEDGPGDAGNSSVFETAKCVKTKKEGSSALYCHRGH